MPPEPFQISVTRSPEAGAGLPATMVNEIRSVIYNAFQIHLIQKGYVREQVQVGVLITELQAIGRSLRMAFAVTLQTPGQTDQGEVHAKKRLADMSENARHGYAALQVTASLIGAAIGGALAMGIAKALVAKPTGRTITMSILVFAALGQGIVRWFIDARGRDLADLGNEILLDGVRECARDACMWMDRSVGKESGSAQNWVRNRKLGWVVTLAGAALTFVIAIKDSAVTAVLATGILAPVFFIFTYMVRLLLMPEEFFLADPHGRKALERTGAKSVTWMRVLAVVLALVMLAIILPCLIGMMLEPSNGS